MTLRLQPITYEDACVFIAQWHRHHLPPWGWRWGVAVNDGTKIVGVATVARPVAREFCQERVCEVTRLCLLPRDEGGIKNAGSKLLSACEAAALGRGAYSLISYVLAGVESGVTYKASGWRPLYRTKGKTWNTQSRPRIDKHQTGDKQLWLSPRSVDPRDARQIKVFRVENINQADEQLCLFSLEQKAVP